MGKKSVVDEWSEYQRVVPLRGEDYGGTRAAKHHGVHGSGGCQLGNGWNGEEKSGAGDATLAAGKKPRGSA